MVNKSLGYLLHCLVSEHTRNWNLILPHAEFAYNDSVNRSTGLSPFKIVTSRRPRKPVDLVPMSIHARVSESAESFAEHIKSLHDSIRQRLEVSNGQ